MPVTLNARELSPELRKRLGVRRASKRSMTMHQVRTHAIRVLAVLAELTSTERARVLRHAGKLNEV